MSGSVLGFLRALVLASVSAVILSGCQSTPEAETETGGETSERSFADKVREEKPPAGPLHSVRDGVYDPIQTIIYAAQSAPEPISGTFGYKVRNSDVLESGVGYLNSELNYREQTNVSVAIHPEVVNQLAYRFGRNWINEIIGKNIEVKGQAVRVPIGFEYNDGTPAYYYQTQVIVTQPNQLKVIEWVDSAD